MTTEEMFQLLLSKFTSIEGELKELQQGQTRLEHGQTELRSDVNELKQGQARLETKIDTVQSTQDNMRLGIRNLRRITDEFRNEINDRFDKQAKSVHYLDKSVAHFHERINIVEEEVKEIKARLDRAS